MEQWFRIALWMFCLIGYLQAKPVTNRQEKLCFNIADLGLQLLSNVSCGDNVTFTSPANVQIGCQTAALKCFKEGLERALTACNSDNWQINQTLDVLEKEKPEHCKPTPTNSSECKWENKGSLKQFKAFVNDFEELVQQINSNSTY